MAFVHGKGTFISVAGTNLSTFTNSVELKRAGDSHDITCFGATAHAYQGGLLDGTMSLKGIYDDGDTTKPRQVIGDALGTTVAFVYEAAGAVTLQPKVTGTGVVTSYEESAAVAEMITWTAELQITGAVTTTDQP